MTESQAAITRGFARALGPFLILFGAAIASRASEMGLLAAGFFQDGPLVLVTGAFTLGVGCAMFAAHHHWSSLASIIISFFGIVTALRGVVLLCAPHFLAPFAAHLTTQPAIIYVPTAIAVLLGLYLAIVGWFGKR
jgi:hypothetical protein